MSKFAKIFALSALLVGFTVACTNKAADDTTDQVEVEEQQELVEDPAAADAEEAEEAAEDAQDDADEAEEAAEDAEDAADDAQDDADDAEDAADEE